MCENSETEASLRHQLNVYEKELGAINEKLRSVRREARDESVAASSCRQGVALEKIKHWRDSTARLQSEALCAQQKIGETNRKLRALRASANHQHNRRERERAEREELFLSCFFTVVRDSVDPRQFKAFERDAKALAQEHTTMNREKS